MPLPADRRRGDRAATGVPSGAPRRGTCPRMPRREPAPRATAAWGRHGMAIAACDTAGAAKRLGGDRGSGGSGHRRDGAWRAGRQRRREGGSLPFSQRRGTSSRGHEPPPRKGSPPGSRPRRTGRRRGPSRPSPCRGLFPGFSAAASGRGGRRASALLRAPPGARILLRMLRRCDSRHRGLHSAVAAHGPVPAPCLSWNRSGREGARGGPGGGHARAMSGPRRGGPARRGWPPAP